MAAEILQQGGSAVDAAITGMLCSGVVQPASSGIGGGGFMTVRLNNGSVFALNFRETAPLAADENMFDGNSTLSRLVLVYCMHHSLGGNRITSVECMVKLCLVWLL
jgi:gamma-glutamyltranspeptidase